MLDFPSLSSGSTSLWLVHTNSWMAGSVDKIRKIHVSIVQISMANSATLPRYIFALVSLTLCSTAPLDRVLLSLFLADAELGWGIWVVADGSVIILVNLITKVSVLLQKPDCIPVFPVHSSIFHSHSKRPRSIARTNSNLESARTQAAAPAHESRQTWPDNQVPSLDYLT